MLTAFIVSGERFLPQFSVTNSRSTFVASVSSRSIDHVSAARANMIRLLSWTGRACNHLYWARHYFFLPLNENDPEEMAVYNLRIKW